MPCRCRVGRGTCLLVDLLWLIRQGVVEGTVLLAQDPIGQTRLRSACAAVFSGCRQGLFKSTVLLRKTRQVKGCFAPLALQADGRDGIQQFCWRKACKGKICFARFAAQTLLASNFCLARQKSPKSRLKERGYSAGITMGQA